MMRLIVIILLAICGCSKYKVIEPDGDRSFTEYLISETDIASKAANLPILRKMPIDNDYTEIRIWVGFGPLIVQDLYSIKLHENTKVTGKYIWYFETDSFNSNELEEFRSEVYKDCKKIKQFKNTEACNYKFKNKIEWQEIYNKLIRIDIWNMPDESEIPKYRYKNVIAIADGQYLVVELKSKGHYYSFGHRLSPMPIKKKHRFANKILKIILDEVNVAD